MLCIVDDDDSDGAGVGGGGGGRAAAVWFTKDVVHHPRFDSVSITPWNKQVGQIKYPEPHERMRQTAKDSKFSVTKLKLKHWRFK